MDSRGRNTSTVAVISDIAEDDASGLALIARVVRELHSQGAAVRCRTVGQSSADVADVTVLVTGDRHPSMAGHVSRALELVGCPEAVKRPLGLVIRSPHAEACTVEHVRLLSTGKGVTMSRATCVTLPDDWTARGPAARQEAGQAVQTLADELLHAGRQRELPAHGSFPRPGRTPASDTSSPARYELARRSVPECTEVRRAVRYVDEHFARGTLSLEEVAAVAYMSRFHFSRMFRNHTSRRFVDYVTELRLAQAGVLLLSTDLAVGEVAKEVGYRDMSNFQRSFRRFFDAAPSSFRLTHTFTSGTHVGVPDIEE